MSTRSRIIIFHQACGSGGCQSVHRAVCSNCRIQTLGTGPLELLDAIRTPRDQSAVAAD